MINIDLIDKEYKKEITKVNKKYNKIKKDLFYECFFKIKHDYIRARALWFFKLKCGESHDNLNKNNENLSDEQQKTIIEKYLKPSNFKLSFDIISQIQELNAMHNIFFNLYKKSNKKQAEIIIDNINKSSAKKNNLYTPITEITTVFQAKSINFLELFIEFTNHNTVYQAIKKENFNYAIELFSYKNNAENIKILKYIHNVEGFSNE